MNQLKEKSISFSISPNPNPVFADTLATGIFS